MKWPEGKAGKGFESWHGKKKNCPWKITLENPLGRCHVGNRPSIYFPSGVERDHPWWSSWLSFRSCVAQTSFMSLNPGITLSIWDARSLRGPWGLPVARELVPSLPQAHPGLQGAARAGCSHYSVLFSCQMYTVFSCKKWVSSILFCS